MKRRRKEVQIFNLSAIDLFACAMAAFIIITIALIPYYGKNSSAVRAANAEAQKQKQAAAEEREQRKETEQKLAHGTMTLMLRATAEHHEIEDVPGLTEANQGFDVLDIDLIVQPPNGQLIWFGNRGAVDSGRITADAPLSGGINMFVARTAKPGRYVIWANLQAIDDRATETYSIGVAFDAVFPRQVENIVTTMRSNQINSALENLPPSEAGRLKIMEFELSPTNDITVTYALGR